MILATVTVLELGQPVAGAVVEIPRQLHGVVIPPVGPLFKGSKRVVLTAGEKVERVVRGRAPGREHTGAEVFRSRIWALQLLADDLTVTKVDVWETENCFAYARP